MGQGYLFWRLTFTCAVIITITAALYPNFKLSDLLYGLKVDDAFVHMCAFAIVTMAATYAWRLSWAVITLLVLFAIALEVGQIYSPGREVHLDDVMASVSGIGLGSIVPVVSLGLRRTLR